MRQLFCLLDHFPLPYLSQTIRFHLEHPALFFSLFFTSPIFSPQIFFLSFPHSNIDNARNGALVALFLAGDATYYAWPLDLLHSLVSRRVRCAEPCSWKHSEIEGEKKRLRKVKTKGSATRRCSWRRCRGLSPSSSATAPQPQPGTHGM